MTGDDDLMVEAIVYVLHLFMVFVTALVVWWLHRYVPFIPDMHFGQSIALVAVVHVLRRWA